MPETLTLSVDGPIAVITLNRPDRRNAVNAQMAQKLRTAIKGIEADPAIAVTILTGAGQAFCAGMDLAAFGAGESEGILGGKGRFAGFASLARRKPVIAAVNGPAMAGGFELVLACDMAVAVDNAVFALPEAKRGLIAGAGGVFRLAQRLPIAIVNELILIGDPIPASRALDLGLINRIVPASELMDCAQAMAKKIAASAPLSVSLGLELVREAAHSNDADLWAANDRNLGVTVASEDAQEGARAFLEKRAPVWRGV